MRIIIVTTFALLGLASFAAASGNPASASYPKHLHHDRDAGPSSLSRGDVPDCLNALPLTVPAGLDTTLNGDTTGNPSLVAAYGCTHWEESGPEVVYELQVDQAVRLFAAIDSPLVDLDIFLLSDCDSDSCLAAGINQFGIDLPGRPEPYYLVVDGYLGAAGAYNLTVRTETGLLDQQACDDAEAVACETIDIQGSVYDRPNLVTMADCGSYLAFGGEAWYSLVLPDRAELDLEVLEINFDAVIWVFDDCGPEPVCLGYADGGVSAEPEEFFFVNDSGGDLPLLLGIDAIEEISADNGDSPLTGGFTLSVSCSVPVASESSSFGDLKSLFR